MSYSAEEIAKHFDTDTLDMLKDIMEDGFSALLQTYIDDSKTRIDELKKSFADGDGEGVRRSAHSLKGSSGNLGASQMADLCLHVEHAGKEGNLDGLAEQIEKIETEYNSVADIMRSML